MNSPTKVATPSAGRDSGDTLFDETLNEHDRALVEHRAVLAARTSAVTTQSLSIELQRIVQVLCDTYEAIDLRIETTLGAAETDFLAAMPEVAGHGAELRQLVALLIADLRTTVAGVSDQPLLLRFAYQDRGDLVEQLLSGAKARVVVVPTEENVSLHANIKGYRK